MAARENAVAICEAGASHLRAARKLVEHAHYMLETPERCSKCQDQKIWSNRDEKSARMLGAHRTRGSWPMHCDLGHRSG
jgi:hypothetical protein